MKRNRLRNEWRILKHLYHRVHQTIQRNKMICKWCVLSFHNTLVSLVCSYFELNQSSVYSGTIATKNFSQACLSVPWVQGFLALSSNNCGCGPPRPSFDPRLSWQELLAAESKEPLAPSVAYQASDYWNLLAQWEKPRTIGQLPLQLCSVLRTKCHKE